MPQSRVAHTEKSCGDTASMRRLATIVESSSDAIIGIAFDGLINSWNRAAERLFGYNANEVIGHPITLLMPPGSDNEMIDLLSQIKSGERIDPIDTTRLRKDGQNISVSQSISPIFDDDGRITGAASIFHDVTEQKRAEKTRRTQSSMEATSLLAGGIAHDLNNLMAAVLGNAELVGLEFQDRLALLQDWM